MKVLVIGGYGNFGRRLVDSLITHYNYDIVVGGRSKHKLEAFKRSLNHLQHIGIVEIDIFSPTLQKSIESVAPDVVVNAVGPYQHQSKGAYAVAKACIACNCHYIDLADDRNYVNHFSKELNKILQEKGLTLVTGASTVPALTHAVLSHFESQFDEMTSLKYGISPGNQTERGMATVSSILSYTGQPFTTRNQGANTTIYGWQGLSRHDFGGPIGKRWMSHCDIPDLDIIPQCFPAIQNISFQAGLEVSVMHLGLWVLSWLSRFKLVDNWQKYTPQLVKMSHWFTSWGSDCGGMFIELTGTDSKGQTTGIQWQLVAEHGSGPNVPTIAAEIVLSKLANDSLKSGATPCIGMFNLNEFFQIASRWGITQHYRVLETTENKARTQMEV